MTNTENNNNELAFPTYAEAIETYRNINAIAGMTAATPKKTSEGQYTIEIIG